MMLIFRLLCSLFLDSLRYCFFLFFFFNDTATTEIYTLSLHDALPIWLYCSVVAWPMAPMIWTRLPRASRRRVDRKSTRLNSSHLVISYAVFCLKKKKNKRHDTNDYITDSHGVHRSIATCTRSSAIATS